MAADPYHNFKLLELVGQVTTVPGGVSRLKVPSGWVLVSHGAALNMLFVADPDHEWKLEPEQSDS